MTITGRLVSWCVDNTCSRDARLGQKLMLHISNFLASTFLHSYSIFKDMLVLFLFMNEWIFVAYIFVAFLGLVIPFFLVLSTVNFQLCEWTLPPFNRLTPLVLSVQT
jgi:hypothetical protein